jgi:hypothetical protein
MSSKQYRTAQPEDFQYFTAYELAKELGRPYREIHQQLDAVHRLVPARMLRRRGTATLYPADTVEVLRGLLGHGHRSLEPPERDWLSRYLMSAND